MTEIGRITREKGISVVNAQGKRSRLEIKGYEQFAKIFANMKVMGDPKQNDPILDRSLIGSPEMAEQVAVEPLVARQPRRCDAQGDETGQSDLAFGGVFERKERKALVAA